MNAKVNRSTCKAAQGQCLLLQGLPALQDLGLTGFQSGLDAAQHLYMSPCQFSWCLGFGSHVSGYAGPKVKGVCDPQTSRVWLCVIPTWGVVLHSSYVVQTCQLADGPRRAERSRQLLCAVLRTWSCTCPFHIGLRCGPHFQHTHKRLRKRSTSSVLHRSIKEHIRCFARIHLRH